MASYKPRLKSCLLSTPTAYAGLGAPNIRRYYKAVTLDQAKHWWTSHPTPSWLQIKSKTTSQPLYLLLAALWMNFHSPSSFLLFVTATATTWKGMQQTSKGICIDALLSLPLLPLQLLSPDLPIQHCTITVITTIGDLFQQQELQSFQQLSTSYNLPSRNLYIFLRLRYVLSSLTTTEKAISKDLLSFCTQSSTKTKGISYI